MKSCSFFGHRDIVGITEERVISAIEKTVSDDGTGVFYVGNNGSFDRLVIGALTKIANKYPAVVWYIVIAYMDTERGSSFKNTIYPEGLESTPRKFCIDKRNRWMIDHSDIVITHVVHPFGNSERYRRIAERKGKKIYNII